MTKVNAEIEALQTKIDYYSKRAASTKPGEKKTQLLETMDELIAKKKQLIEELNQ